MGLCNEERYERMIFACEKLNNLKYHFKDQYGFEKFYELLDQIWPFALQTFSSGSLWLLGTSSMSDHPSGPHNPWEVALKTHFNAERNNNEHGLKLNEIHILEDDYELGTFVNFSGAVDSKMLEYVLDVQDWSENVNYGLKRYEDEFAKDFKNLSDLIAKIQGECFSIFKDNPAYASAFLARQCVIKILQDFEELEDFAKSTSLYISLWASSKLPLFDLMEYHRALFKGDCKKYNGEEIERISNLTKFLIFVDLLNGNLEGQGHVEKFFKICEKYDLKEHPEISKRIWDKKEAKNKAKENDKVLYGNYEHMYFVHGSCWDCPEEQIMLKRKLEKEFWEERDEIMKEAKEAENPVTKTSSKKKSVSKKKTSVKKKSTSQKK